MKEDSDSNIAYLAGNFVQIFYIILFYLSLLGILP
jgi:hypothetical protein